MAEKSLSQAFSASNVGVSHIYMNKQPGSWIYILLSSSDYTRCKIGKTINNPLIRYRQLRTGDPYLGFAVAYYIPDRFGSISGFETDIHFEFQCYRIDNFEDRRSEWFSINAKAAEFHIDCLLEEWTGQKILSSLSFNCDELIKMYEGDIRSTFEPDPYELAFINDIFNNK